MKGVIYCINKSYSRYYNYLWDNFLKNYPGKKTTYGRYEIHNNNVFFNIGDVSIAIAASPQEIKAKIDTRAKNMQEIFGNHISSIILLYDFSEAEVKYSSSHRYEPIFVNYVHNYKVDREPIPIIRPLYGLIPFSTITTVCIYKSYSEICGPEFYSSDSETIYEATNSYRLTVECIVIWGNVDTNLPMFTNLLPGDPKTIREYLAKRNIAIIFG